MVSGEMSLYLRLFEKMFILGKLVVDEWILGKNSSLYDFVKAILIVYLNVLRYSSLKLKYLKSLLHFLSSCLPVCSSMLINFEAFDVV